MSTQDEKIRHKAQEIFERHGKYVEKTLRDAHRDGLIDHADFPCKAHMVSSFILGMLLQAKVKNDPEVLRNLSPTIMQMIGAGQRGSGVSVK